MRSLVFLVSPFLFLFTNCSQDKGANPDSDPQWACTWDGKDSLDYLHTLGCEADFSMLEGAPLSSAHGQAGSVKFLFSLQTDRLYFSNSNRYDLHFEFAQTKLGLSEAEIANWNTTQYRENAQRSFVLGTVNHYTHLGVYTLQLFPGDDLGTEHLRTVFEKIQSSTWFGSDLRFVPMSEDAVLRAKAARIPMILPDSLHQGQVFQSMNPGEAYGTLVRATASTVATAEFNRHDIVLTDGIPNALPVVAGVVTTTFQTPLSHINVLSRNRGTPNMALRTAWTDSQWAAWEGKLVHLVVTLDHFVLEPATQKEAQAFWDSTGPGKAPTLPLDSNPAILSTEEMSLSHLARIGAKAGNFGELAKLSILAKQTWKVPEGGFAIPFIHYLRHMHRHGLDTVAMQMRNDSLFQVDAQVRKAALESLQSRILQAELDTGLLHEVESRIAAGGYPRMRFRSSTNAEDLAGFNGAGLYSSYTGIWGDTKKSVGLAIRKVWASLWNFRAYEERSYFRIDQSRVAMSVLVHRGFPDEEANGVAFTYNIYKPEYFGYVINVQKGDVSVVTPPEGVQCEQLIYYPFSSDYVGETSIEPISSSSLTNGAPVLSNAEIVNLGRALHYVEYRYQPQRMDVEFKFDGPGRTLYLKQARPAP